MAKPNLLGPWGESLGAEYLVRKKYRILSSNYRTRFGEIDLIAQKGGMLVFVEVKLRRSQDFAQAREFVDTQKQMRIRASAEVWLAENETNLQPRFDVIEIYAPDGMQTINPQIVHLEDAFS